MGDRRPRGHPRYERVPDEHQRAASYDTPSLKTQERRLIQSEVLMVFRVRLLCKDISTAVSAALQYLAKKTKNFIIFSSKNVIRGIVWLFAALCKTRLSKIYRWFFQSKETVIAFVGMLGIIIGGLTFFYVVVLIFTKLCLVTNFISAPEAITEAKNMLRAWNIIFIPIGLTLLCILITAHKVIGGGLFLFYAKYCMPVSKAPLYINDNRSEVRKIAQALLRKEL